MKVEQTECSEMSYKIQMLGNYPEESIKQAPPYLVNETNLVHNLFLVYFISFIYNLYTFWTFPSPSSGGTTVFMQHLVLVIPYSCILYILQTSQLYRITSIKCRINTVVPPDDGPGEVQNM